MNEQAANHLGKIGLLDGDIVAYRAAAIAEPVRYLAEFANAYQKFDSSADLKAATEENSPLRIWNHKEDKGFEFAKMALDNTLTYIKEHLQPKSIEIYLSDKSNFRYNAAITQPYKGNRDVVRPKYLKKIKEFLVNEYAASSWPNLEADDVLSIRATRLGEDSIIGSIDKDLHQIAGWHYNWVSGTALRISQKEACVNLFKQIITGDPSDSIPGLPGYGIKAAEKCLDGGTDAKDLFARVWDLYRNGVDFIPDIIGKWEYFREQASLVFLLRSVEDTILNIPGYVSLEELEN